MNMIERVARAMAERSKARQPGMFTINALPMDGDEDFLALARAAIEEMRTPTKQMAKAGEDEAIRCSCAECCAQAYTAMIDAALQEG